MARSIRDFCGLDLSRRVKSYDDYIARPITGVQPNTPFSWKNESVLILGPEDSRLGDLADALSKCGASVSFHRMNQFQDLYKIPLDHFTIVIMYDDPHNQQCDIEVFGGALRRADTGLVLIWASPHITFSEVADRASSTYCDIMLALPSSPGKISLFFK